MKDQEKAGKEKVKESNTTGAVGGFQTLKAFVRNTQDKRKQ